MIRSEVGDVAYALRSAKEAGEYWDPVNAPVRMVRFKESGGLLATEPTTSVAYQACDELRRSLTALTGKIRERWYEACGVLLPPHMFTFKPPVESSDNLPAVLEAAARAEKELSHAMEAMG
jgi:hypothetical protein